MRWDYPLLDISPVFPGLGVIIIIIIIMMIIIIIIYLQTLKVFSKYLLLHLSFCKRNNNCWIQMQIAETW